MRPVCLLLLFIAAAAAADYSVAPAPAGQPTGDGTLVHPFDLTTALLRAQPGDTLYLRTGNYRPVDADSFLITTSGTPTAPITVRAYASELPHIDGGFEITASWIIIRDLELSASLTKRRTQIPGPWPDDIVTPSGFQVFGTNVKIINCIVHDLQEGVDGWKDASNLEVYGNLIFFNGWNAPDRGHGHGMYSQNQTGNKWVHDNIVFHNFAQGMQLYGTSETFLNGFDVRGNIVYQNGSPSGEYTRNILLGGTAPMNRPVLSENMTYSPVTSAQGGSNSLGYTTGGLPCTEAVADGNYFASASNALSLVKCTLTSLRGNTFIGPVTGFTPYAWPDNTYLAATSRPASARVFVRPNRYEPGRANIAIYNWPLLTSVNVDMSNIGLQPGDEYELRSAQDPFTDVTRGTYTGAPIPVSMTARSVARPRGWTAPASTFPEFGAFLIRKRQIPAGTTTPATPSLPVAQAISATQVRLTWTGTADRYRVYRDGALVDVLAATAYEDNDLSPNTLYSYAVRAENAAGNLSPATTAVAARTLTIATPPPGTTWLSDWPFVRMSNGLGPAERDRSNGGAPAGDGTPLRILGTTYAKGLGVHAWSANTFHLGGNCTTFEAKVGMDDESRPGGQISFKVIADGAELFNSGTLDNTSPLRTVNVNLTGKYTLQLIVTPGWDGRANDHADWADAKVNCLSSDPPPVNMPPSVTITSPGTGAQFPAASNVTLTASASDPDGSVSKVEFYRASTLIGTAAAAPWTVVWTGAASGSWALTARAYDNLGAVTQSAPVSITVAAVPPPGNGLPPAVQLAAPEPMSRHAPGTAISLVAQPVDPENLIAKVEFFSGTTKLGESLQAPWTLEWNPATAANHMLSAKVTDKAGLTSVSDTVPVIIALPPNRSPVVTLTAPTTATAGAPVELTAVAADADGSIKKVEFYHGITKLGEDLSAPYTFTWSNPAVGSYILTARAVDNLDGAGTSAPVTLTVLPKRRQPPVVTLVTPVVGSTYAAAATIPLLAQASDPDGTVVKVEFYRFGVKIGEARSAPWQSSWVNATTGIWNLTARAYDDSGEITTSQGVDIGVNTAVRRSPVVTWAAPTAPQTLAVPANLVLAVNTYDPDGVVRKVEFFRDGIKLGEDTTAPYTFNWGSIAPGAYVLTARATDDKAQTGSSDPLVVQVNPAVKQSPVVFLLAPVDQTWAFAGASMTLRADAGSPASTISRVEFWRSGYRLGQSLAPPYTYTWTSPPVGRWELVAKAFDAAGNVATSAPANIAVTAAINQLPQISLVAPATAVAPASVTLEAAATDPDGAIRKVEFYNGTFRLGEVLSGAYRYTWTGVQAGEYILTARATDSTGAIVTSAPVKLVVSR